MSDLQRPAHVSISFDAGGAGRQPRAQGAASPLISEGKLQSHQRAPSAIPSHERGSNRVCHDTPGRIPRRAILKERDVACSDSSSRRSRYRGDVRCESVQSLRMATSRSSLSAGMARRGSREPTWSSGRTADRRQQRNLPSSAFRHPTGLRSRRPPVPQHDRAVPALAQASIRRSSRSSSRSRFRSTSALTAPSARRRRSASRSASMTVRLISRCSMSSRSSSSGLVASR